MHSRPDAEGHRTAANSHSSSMTDEGVFEKRAVGGNAQGLGAGDWELGGWVGGCGPERRNGGELYIYLAESVGGGIKFT